MNRMLEQNASVAMNIRISEVLRYSFGEPRRRNQLNALEYTFGDAVAQQLIRHSPSTGFTRDCGLRWNQSAHCTLNPV
jgi:hypothetical protein